MIYLEDGPGHGQAFRCERSPKWLRVVYHSVEHKWNVLDQPDDTPDELEVVHVYELASYRGQTFACARGEGTSSVTANAVYRHVTDVDADLTVLRDTDRWRQWIADRAGVPLQVVLDQLAQEANRGAV